MIVVFYIIWMMATGGFIYGKFIELYNVDVFTLCILTVCIYIHILLYSRLFISIY